MKIVITEKAQVMLSKKLTDPGSFLRLTVVEGGCAGMTYDAEIGQEMKTDERLIMEDGMIRIVASLDNEKYLDGLAIDYSDDLVNAGLRFSNSKSKSTCGCGASFSLAGFPVKGDSSCCS